VIPVLGLEQNSAVADVLTPFGQIIKCQKYFGLRYRTNDVLTFLVRSSTSKIFRPEAGASVSLALPSVQGAMRQRRGAEFCSFPNAGVRQAPAKRMRQRQGANFCSLFNASVP
jgi:hypothetical protein